MPDCVSPGSSASGSGRIELDDEIVEVEERDIIRVLPGAIRAYEAGPGGLDVPCVGGGRTKGGDTEGDEAVRRPELDG